MFNIIKERNGLYIMKVTGLKDVGLYVPYEKLDSVTITEVKYRLIDAILSLIGGALWVPKDELESLYTIINKEPMIRPVWPLGIKTNLEMAGFLNAYFLRYADWGDTYRRLRRGVGGHPSDQIAAILALSDSQGVSGTRIIELVHLSYQLWAILQEQMFFARPDIDYTTTLTLTVPVLAATCFDESPQIVQNALNLSASSGILLEQIRREVTNMKSAASSYAIARGLWCYRLSKVIQAPISIFDGEYGWYKVVAPLEGELIGLGTEATYPQIQVKGYPCCNANQASVECALLLHGKINEQLEKIQRIVVHISSVDATYAFKPGQAKYPMCQADADHHLKYCVATALNFGNITPLHYGNEYLQNKTTQHLIDLIEAKVLTPNEADNKLSNEDGACIVKIFMNDGTVITERQSISSGVLSGLKADEREERFQKVLEQKCKMIENVSGLNLAPVFDTILKLEEYNGSALIDRIQFSLQL